ncbi:MAG: hypothetical protein JWN66_2145 [Sphingomonas bacterium]|uniref:hypothetical protein n=1 Tax=Sphingomonas bacterium TaxID=1895847 RepID=UPI002626B088|nr:hypothetical protein [Sphingomonas bacterium]MDB5705029.1 hypothetical protein [Sphingomonas bacterium]
MIDPAILDAMLAAGASAEVIVAAVKADAARDDARREAQRAGNARRQRRYRDRLHGEETGDLFAEPSPSPGLRGEGQCNAEDQICPTTPLPCPLDDAGNALRNATPGVTAAIPPSFDKSPRTPKINSYPREPGEIPAREAPRFACPAGCDPGDWRDLLANRRAKRLAMTPAAYRKLLRDLAAQADDAWPPGRLLAHAAEKGWAQIFDPRDDHRGASRHGHRPAARSVPAPREGEPHNPLVRAVLRSEARGAGGGGAGF